MNHPTAPLVVLALEFIVALPIHGDELPVISTKVAVMSAEKLELVDFARNDSVAKNLIPGGIVMIARHRKIVYFKAFRKMDLEADVPMTTDAILRFYSMTKAISTTVAMILGSSDKSVGENVVKRRVSLIASIWFPGFSPQNYPQVVRSN